MEIQKSVEDAIKLLEENLIQIDEHSLVVATLQNLLVFCIRIHRLNIQIIIRELSSRKK